MVIGERKLFEMTESVCVESSIQPQRDKHNEMKTEEPKDPGKGTQCVNEETLYLSGKTWEI